MDGDDVERHEEAARIGDRVDATMIRGAGVLENLKVAGRYDFECFDKDGNLKWTDSVDNLITTEGKNFIWDNILAGSAYTTVGPFMGLISSVTYSTIVVADTMASHAGWKEAGSTNAPTISGTRMTLNGLFSAAASGAKASSAVTFTATGSGTLKGVFLAIGTGAVATLMSTAGTLLSAGLFTGGDKVMANGDQLNATFTGTLT